MPFPDVPPPNLEPLLEAERVKLRQKFEHIMAANQCLGPENEFLAMTGLYQALDDYTRVVLSEINAARKRQKASEN